MLGSMVGRILPNPDAAADITVLSAQAMFLPSLENIWLMVVGNDSEAIEVDERAGCVVWDILVDVTREARSGEYLSCRKLWVRNCTQFCFFVRL
jgi:hypothetical protein